MSDGMELFARGWSLEPEPRRAGEERGVPGYHSSWKVPSDQRYTRQYFFRHS